MNTRARARARARESEKERERDEKSLTDEPFATPRVGPQRTTWVKDKDAAAAGLDLR